MVGRAAGFSEGELLGALGNLQQIGRIVTPIIFSKIYNLAGGSVFFFVLAAGEILQLPLLRTLGAAIPPDVTPKLSDCVQWGGGGLVEHNGPHKKIAVR